MSHVVSSPENISMVWNRQAKLNNENSQSLKVLLILDILFFYQFFGSNSMAM